MKIYRIMIFIVMFNLIATMLAGLDVFKWGATGQSFSPDWAALAVAMISTALVTGVFGLLTQTAASTVAGIFWAGGGIVLTVSTMNWLALPGAITLVVDGVVGMLGFFAIVQILTGVTPD